MKVFEGNVDSQSVKHTYLDEPVIARFIKIHIIHWHQHPSLRLELLACQGIVILANCPPLINHLKLTVSELKHKTLSSVGIHLKELGGGSDVEMFEILHRD